MEAARTWGWGGHLRHFSAGNQHHLRAPIEICRKRKKNPSSDGLVVRIAPIMIQRREGERERGGDERLFARIGEEERKDREETVKQWRGEWERRGAGGVLAEHGEECDGRGEG
jgi:hypothetical protein